MLIVFSEKIIYIDIYEKKNRISPRNIFPKMCSKNQGSAKNIY